MVKPSPSVRSSAKARMQKNNRPIKLRRILGNMGKLSANDFEM